MDVAVHFERWQDLLRFCLFISDSNIPRNIQHYVHQS